MPRTTPPPAALPARLLTATELAQRLGTSQRHIRRLAVERRIPSLKVGKFVRFDEAAVAEWLQEHKVDAIED